MQAGGGNHKKCFWPVRPQFGPKIRGGVGPVGPSPGSATVNSLWTLTIIKHYYTESHSLFCYFLCSIGFFFLSAGWIRQHNTPITFSTHSPFKVSLGKQHTMFSVWMPVEMINGHVSVNSICTKVSPYKILNMANHSFTPFANYSLNSVQGIFKSSNCWLPHLRGNVKFVCFCLFANL